MLLLVERQRRLGRDAQRDRLRQSPRSLVRRECLGLTIYAHRQALEFGRDIDRVGDLELGRILEGIRLFGGGEVLPRHLRHPRSVDEIGIDGGEEGLLVREMIDNGSTRLDHGITAAGLGEGFALKDRVNIAEHNEIMNYRPCW